MRSFETMASIAETAENALATGHWDVQVWENQELDCFEASFVIELDGISFSKYGKGMLVFQSNAENREKSTVQKSLEEYL